VSKIETALDFFDSYNCAQSVLCTYAAECGLKKDKALQAAIGFGGGMGRLQETCGAVTGAIIVLGLSSGFKEGDGRDKISESYAKVRRLVNDFSAREGAFRCRDLLGCDLSTEEGQKAYKENNLRDRCRNYIRLSCELLDEYLEET
jgi:C_GCAxxG_C_C family probable redox protein